MRQVIAPLVIALVAGASVAAAQSPGNRGAVFVPTTDRPSVDEENSRVIIAPEVLDGWNFLYTFITEVEFVLCLEGHKKNGVIHVDGFRLARIEEARATSVRYQPCTGDRYVGTAHNHPPVESGGPLCYRSIPDRQSFDLDTRAMVDIVICGRDRYLWALKDGTTGGRLDTDLPD